MKHTAVIMAGGKGERFWPQSRAHMPKQFLSLTSDGKTMLQLTVERLLPCVDISDIFIVTNRDYYDVVYEQLPSLPQKNILCEPMAKNTAPCIAYAAAVISSRYGDAVMYVMPSDHIIKNKALYRDTLELAASIATENTNLVTLGITPSYAETGYGYIRFINERIQGQSNVYRVERFVEKPDAKTAKQYLEEGTYLWNSGMFVWKASSFIKNLEEFLPEVAKAARIIRDLEDNNSDRYDEELKKAFTLCPSVSVDYGIMEKAENIYTIPGSFGWDDVGSWLSLSRINPLDTEGNYCSGNIVTVDCENSILVSDKRLLSAVGLEDMIVVATEDAIMVCQRDEAQRVKEIVQALRDKKMTHLL